MNFATLIDFFMMYSVSGSTGLLIQKTVRLAFNLELKSHPKILGECALKVLLFDIDIVQTFDIRLGCFHHRSD